MRAKIVIMLTGLLLISNFCLAHQHTHIGRNADGIWGNSDDNQLWVFATPSSPQWGTLEMHATGEFFGNKQIYVAELDCFHSAHPPTGAFQLGGSDINVMPDWEIGIQRVSFSDSTNFWMENEATGQEILSSDGDIFSFGQPLWEDELYNENSQQGAWHFHAHTEFIALADGSGETFSISLKAVDLGSTGFSDSQVYTMDFVTVPEPASIVVISTGVLAFYRRKRHA